MPPLNHRPGASEDRALTARIRDGDVAAFEMLFHEYYATTFRFAVSFIGDTDAAQDIVQHLFGWIWTHRTEWSPAGSILLYLLAAVRHRALDRLRDARRQDRAILHYIGPTDAPAMGAQPLSADTALERTELQLRVWRAVHDLPEVRRTVLILRWQQGLEWPDVARVMGLSIGAARVQHSRALRMLRDRLASLR